MATKKTTGKKLADMMYGNPEGAAFGITPMIGKRREDRQDREAAKSFPVDLARGAVAGFVGMPADILNIPGAVYSAVTDKDLYKIPYGSEDILKSLPFGTETPAGQFASGLGILGGGSANIGPAIRGVKAGARGALAAGRAGARMADKVVPQIMERGGAGADILSGLAQGTRSQIFIGPKAKTFHQGRADMATAMEEAGRTPQEIWLATGTFRGADGILRQEIDDRAAKFLTADERKQRIDSAKSKIAEMKEKIKPTPQKDLFPKALTEAKKEVRDDINILKSDIKSREKNPRTQGLSAPHIFEHPELYAAYPELQGAVKIVTEGGSGGTRGALSINPSRGYYPGSMEIDIYDAGLRNDPTSTALHEMQHAVQTLEGMGPGGNPTFAFQNPEARGMLHKERMNMLKGLSYDDFVRQAGYTDMDQAGKDYVKYTDNLTKGIDPAYDRMLQERVAMEYYKRLLGEAEARAVQDRQMMTPSQRMETPPPASYDVPQEDLIVKPPREYADGGPVHFSDNPDVMQLELAAGGLVKGIKAAAKAAKAEKELALPPVLPRAPAKTREEIRPYAQRMAQQMTGEFYRPNPKKSENVAGKSFSQFKMEKGLEHDIRPTKEVVEPEVADIEKQLGMLKIGISGDTTIADKVLRRAGPYELFDPSPQHGGPRYGLGGEGAWASNNPIAANVQKRVNELSEAYGAPPLGQYMAMGPQGSNFAQHFADANLQAIDTSAMTKSQIEQINKLIREGSQKSGPRPSFPGIEDRGSAYLHFAIDPELRKHFNDLMQKTSVTEKLNLPDGRIILHAITEPELRDKEILNTGFSQMRLKSAFDPESLQISAHPTYSHVIPHEEGSAVTRTKYLTPGELEFSDVLDYAKQHYRPQDMTRVFQTSTPRQIVDPQHIDEMKMYEELMKEYTGKKAGGAVRKAEGGEITADDLILEERKL